MMTGLILFGIVLAFSARLGFVIWQRRQIEACAEILSDASDKVRLRDNWIQQQYRAPTRVSIGDSDVAVAWGYCAVGAILAAGNKRGLGMRSRPVAAALWAARRALVSRDALSSDRGADCARDPVADITSWNDMRSTNHEDVLYMFSEAQKRDNVLSGVNQSVLWRNMSC